MPVNDLINRSLELFPFTFPNLCARVWLSDYVVTLRGNHTVTTTKGIRQLVHGTRLIVNPGEYHAGLKPGSGDRIGFVDTVITPDMVGMSLPVFASVELKTITDTMRQQQRDWFAFVQAHNGVAVVLRETKRGIEEMRELP